MPQPNMDMSTGIDCTRTGRSPQVAKALATNDYTGLALLSATEAKVA